MIDLRVVAAKVVTRRGDLDPLFVMDTLREAARKVCRETLDWVVTATGNTTANVATVALTPSAQSFSGVTVNVEALRTIRVNLSYDSGTTYSPLAQESSKTLDDLPTTPAPSTRANFWVDRMGSVEFSPALSSATPYSIRAAVMPTGNFELVPLPSEWEELVMDLALASLMMVKGPEFNLALGDYYDRRSKAGLIRARAAVLATSGSAQLGVSGFAPRRL